MKATLCWLQEFADIPDDPEEVARALESLGHEVESVTSLERVFAGVVVARVEALRPHPNADRIRLARVTTGDDSVEVVCGAWNFDVGDAVAFSPVGATLAGGLVVDRRAIRGVESPGMICSERELGLSDEHEGILVLDPATLLGSDFAGQVPYPDTVFDLSITTNRPDAMGMIGLARDLAAYYRVPLTVPDPVVVEAGDASAVSVIIEDQIGCPRYVAREVRGVTIAPSPLPVRLRLEAVGVRAINNVVDATNYVLLEYGHPTHAFDLDALGETVVVRRAREGERLRTLDGVDRSLLTDDLVIADTDKAVAFAGVMGGEESEVGDGTTRVLIEAAYFDPPSVMLTSKRHSLRTEASARFERGMDPNAPAAAADRVAELIVATAGGVAAPGWCDAYPRPVSRRTMLLKVAQVPRVLGFDLAGGETAGLLRWLGFGVTGDDPLEVEIPTRRPDIERPIDLLEEVARLHGYDKVPETLPMGTGGGLPFRDRRFRDLREILVGAGYSESMAFSFMARADLDTLGLVSDDRRRRAVPIANPFREEQGLLRTTLLPGLLRAAATNRSRRIEHVALFETGKVFLQGEGRLPDQPDMVAFVAAGRIGEDWTGSGRERDALDAAGTWEIVRSAMQLDGTSLRPAVVGGLHPGRSAEIVVNGTSIGYLGELHPQVARGFDLTGRVAVAEFEAAPFLEDPGLWQFEEPSHYPPVIFDLAFELDRNVPASRLLAAMHRSGGDLLERLDVFDVFSGAPLEEGKKSIAVRLVVRAPDRTLTDAEIAPWRDAIAAEVEEAVGGRLRGGTQ